MNQPKPQSLRKQKPQPAPSPQLSSQSIDSIAFHQKLAALLEDLKSLSHKAGLQGVRICGSRSEASDFDINSLDFLLTRLQLDVSKHQKKALQNPHCHSQLQVVLIEWIRDLYSISKALPPKHAPLAQTIQDGLPIR